MDIDGKALSPHAEGGPPVIIQSGDPRRHTNTVRRPAIISTLWRKADTPSSHTGVGPPVIMPRGGGGPTIIIQGGGTFCHHTQRGGPPVIIQRGGGGRHHTEGGPLSSYKAGREPPVIIQKVLLKLFVYCTFFFIFVYPCTLYYYMEMEGEALSHAEGEPPVIIQSGGDPPS